MKSKKSFNFVTTQPGLEEWVRDFSAHLKTSAAKDMIVYPESFADGFARIHSLEEGLTYRIVDYRLNADFIFERKPSDKYYLIIYIYQYTDCHKLTVQINDEFVIQSDEKTYGSLIMTNSFVSQRLALSAGTYVKGLTIQITDEWLEKKIANRDTANYALFKQKDIFQSFLTAKSQKIFNEIFDENARSKVPELYLNNRVLRLLEMFLENILRFGIKGNSFPASARDMHNILKVENYLRQSYTAVFPGVEAMARLACMSPTKLKRLFKNAFGEGLYGYYQKNRMHKAKELLSSGMFSVTDIGEIIGYQNMSNFSIAFKKEFDCLPKDFKKIG